MDSHVIEKRILETKYTQVMGHMDVLSLVSDGFNIYFPMGILVVGLCTWFKVGARLLSLIGFQQFLTDDEITTDLVSEGVQLIQRGTLARILKSILCLYVYFMHDWKLPRQINCEQKLPSSHTCQLVVCYHDRLLL